MTRHILKAMINKYKKKILQAIWNPTKVNDNFDRSSIGSEIHPTASDLKIHHIHSVSIFRIMSAFQY